MQRFGESDPRGDPIGHELRKDDTRVKMLTKLNIINLALIAVLCAGLIVHAADAETNLRPVIIALPFTDS
jgi:hypothetical protein